LIVLDTHAWVWWMTKPEKLGKKAARAIDKATAIGVPAICPWEIAMKVRAGKLRFDRPCEVWVEDALAADPRVELLPLLPRVAIAAVDLSWAHGDPADRLIVATARTQQAPLATSDREIHDAKLVRCVWD
jgi:PIN domain nuclease of toxin-antitoxin system